MKQGLLLAAAMLLAFEANASPQDLIDSVKNNDMTAVLKLLESGENVNGANEQGNTALHYAIATDNAELSQLLLAYGADFNAANGKGWSPLKIAQTKQLKNVAPILSQASQGKVELPETAAKIKESIVSARQKAEENMFPIVEEERDVMITKPETISISFEPVNKEPEVAETPKMAAQNIEAPAPANTVAPTSDETTNSAQAQPVDNSEKIIKVAELLSAQAIEQAQQDAAQAREGQAIAEAKVKELEAKLKQIEEAKAKEEAAIKAQKEAEEKARIEAENKAKAEAEAKAKAEADARAQKIATMAKRMPSSKPLPKMPVSALTDKIYAGDEEVVYCLNYLGQGENQNMLRAAGFYAAASGINEERYKQIASLSNDFFATAVNADLKKRNDECSKIITPKDKNQQNRIIRSLNQSIGY